ncbi:MAG TPA: hypothetical protein VGM37_11400 [Armatimonadota bacterium]|jgi:hypothetical protein
MCNENLVADIAADGVLALQGAWCANVRLDDPALVRDGGRNAVIRASARGIPDSPVVFVKRFRADVGCGFTDWAALRFLAGRCGDPALAPGFLAGDVARRVLVTREAPHSVVLGDWLLGPDPGARRRTRALLAEVLGRLASLRADLEPEFEAGLALLPETQPLRREREASDLLERRTHVLDWFAAAGANAPPGFADAVSAVARRYAGPGNFLAFSHGDPAPSNGLASPEAVTLVDFEYAAYRHALYDVSGWYILCPLPEAEAQDLVGAFRIAAAPALPAMADGERFREEWAFVCAYRGLWMLSRIPTAVAAKDREWAPGWSAREALLTAMTRLERSTRACPVLSPICEGAGELLRRLLIVWPGIGPERLDGPFGLEEPRR